MDKIIDRLLTEQVLSERYNKPWRRSCKVPGNITDKTYQCFMKFEKWYKRPQKAHFLYWRLHKEDS